MRIFKAVSASLLSIVGLVVFAPPLYAIDPFLPNDPYFSLQWHLDKQATGAVVDANVAGAWARGWTGQGVRIGIIESDQFQTTHPDLAPNYSPGFDFDETGIYGDGGKHATSVAGVAAARGGNGIGVTGVAPHATLSTLAYNTAYGSNDASKARAFAHRNDAIQIKSYSMSLNDQFTSAPLLAQALQNNYSFGTLNVFCAANGATNANKYGDKNHSNQIVVGAVGSNGTFSNYTNYGANLTVCAPSSTDGGLEITTTDLVGGAGYNGGPDSDYTSTFGGTSAATPLVSGILALAKEAQPNLSTRFAKHLLARTSTMIDPGDATRFRNCNPDLLTDPTVATSIGGWHTNAAGIHFNNMYGFGMINAEALCDAAQQYSGFTPLVTEATGTISVGSAVPEDDSLIQAFTLGDHGHIEDLSFDFSLTGMFKSGVEMLITSPSGTQSLLQDGYMYTASNTDTVSTRNWTYLTNAFWGESAVGTWTVTMRDLPWINPNEAASQVTWNSFGITANFGDLIAVPEPGTLLLLAVGSLVLLTCTRRR